MPCKAANRPPAAKAAMLKAGGSVSATTRLCNFSRLFGAAFFFPFIIERKRKINHFQRA